jgi:hypothetical protein
VAFTGAVVITRQISRAATSILLSLALTWLAYRGHFQGVTRRKLQLLTGTTSKSALRRAVAQAKTAGLVQTARLPDGKTAYVLTRTGARALLELIAQ